MERDMLRRLFGLLILAVLAPLASAAASPIPIALRLERLDAEQGLSLSLRTRGDSDGRTTFANEDQWADVRDARRLIRDLRVEDGSGRALSVSQDASGWTVRHAPGQPLTVRYRIAPSGPSVLGAEPMAVHRPIVQAGMLHLVGHTALVLPTGARDSDTIAFEFDARAVADDAHFASSFGPGARLATTPVQLARLRNSLFIGGAIHLSTLDTRDGKIAVALSAMAPGFDRRAFDEDVRAVLGGVRAFYRDSQPWFLIGLHGATGGEEKGIRIGGGTGLERAFTTYVAADYDLRNRDERGLLRWLLAHEYSHQWIGQTLRLSIQGDERKEPRGYWFTEGFTEFFAVRVLTRAGLFDSAQALDAFNERILRYNLVKRRGLGADAAGDRFWSDPDAEQLLYQRGYLAAWQAELSLRRASDGRRGLDDVLQALILKARKQPAYRVDNSALIAAITAGMSAGDAEVFRRFVLDGGESPLRAADFAPCLSGYVQGDGAVLDGRRFDVAPGTVLQYRRIDDAEADCFKH